MERERRERGKERGKEKEREREKEGWLCERERETACNRAIAYVLVIIMFYVLLYYENKLLWHEETLAMIMAHVWIMPLWSSIHFFEVV